jgi:hypothetical protein
MTEIQNNPNISTERIMGIGPGDRFRIKSKLLEDEVREVEVEGFDIQRIEDPEQEEEQDPEVFDLDEVWVVVEGKPEYFLQTLCNGLGGSDKYVEVDWLNPPTRSGILRKRA